MRSRPFPAAATGTGKGGSGRFSRGHASPRSSMPGSRRLGPGTSSTRRFARTRRRRPFPARPPVIEVEGLVRRFGATVAVDGVSFRVDEGELVALVGASGSGKTTTLKMINRLVEPTAGRVRVDGEDAALVAPHLLRRRIGYVFQGAGLFPHMTVEENVALPLTLLGREAGEIRVRVAEVLGLVELDPALGARLPAELSGGQQQRVGVARALVASPRAHAPGRALRRAGPDHPGSPPAVLPRACAAGWVSRACWSPTTWRRRSFSPTGSA